jgi:hypothetical protein
MDLKRFLILLGISPISYGLLGPYIVNVFPEPVCPYAKIVE